jgi:tetratricopeptide (TPR) repeat protein
MIPQCPRRPDRFRSFLGFWNAETSRGEEEAAAFLDRPAHQQRDAPLGFGALQCILWRAHEELDRDPRNALRLTRLALRRALRLAVPDGCEHLRRTLIGRAWKEYGNALLALSKWNPAAIAARRAVRYLADDAVEQHAALLLQASVEADRRQFEQATEAVHRCREVFAAHGDARRLLQTLSLEAIILMRSGKPDRAITVFRAAKMQAEELADTRELARLLNNLGHCEVQLGQTSEGMRHLVEARQAFDREGMSAERPRAVWGFAKILRDRGELGEAAETLRLVRREFLGRGMVIEAALVGIDLLELLDIAGATDEVTSVAQELVEEFSNAGMQPELRIAVAYLAAQRQQLVESLREVRQFLNQLSEHPESQFRGGKREAAVPRHGRSDR